MTNGIPRLTNVVCDRALLGAYVEGKYLINENIIDQAAREVLGKVRERGGRRDNKHLLRTVLLALLLFILGVGVATLYMSRQVSSESVNSSQGGQVERMKQKLKELTLSATSSFMSASSRSWCGTEKRTINVELSEDMTVKNSATGENTT